MRNYCNLVFSVYSVQSVLDRPWFSCHFGPFSSYGVDLTLVSTLDFFFEKLTFTLHVCSGVSLIMTRRKLILSWRWRFETCVQGEFTQFCSQCACLILKIVNVQTKPPISWKENFWNRTIPTNFGIAYIRIQHIFLYRAINFCANANVVYCRDRLKWGDADAK